ncbi:hypothetical protein M9Y10_035353 [Tritrichomonas musculus]|uniref:BACK domain-containing protein n=1 Tax=Tritrichomonas musculus TaxID=1915356 RepID=A0ABR2KHJ1_9EUKA
MLIHDGFPLVSNKRKFFVSKAILKEKLLIFQDDPNLLLMKQFDSLSPVPIDIFSQFINSLKGNLPNINESNVYYYLALSLEFGYVELENECQKCIESNESIFKVIEQLNDPKNTVDKELLESTIIQKFEKSFLSNNFFITLPIDSIYNILQKQEILSQQDYFDFVISLISNRGPEAIKLFNLIDILLLSKPEFMKVQSIYQFFPKSEQKWLAIISKLIEKNTILQEENNQMKSMIDKHMNLFIKSFPMDKTKRGVLDHLGRLQNVKFDRKFIASQSSRDIYNLINPDSKDIFRSGSNDFWITFEFEKPISITGIKLQSTESDFLSSFQVMSGMDILYFTQNEKSLQKPHRFATIQFPPKITQRLTIQQIGNIPFELKYVELASLDDEFPEGIFKKLIHDAGGDSHRAKVKITAKNFDLETFYSLNELSNISTLSDDINWFQVEFLEGKMLVKGYRLKRTQAFLLRGWKVYGSNDNSAPLNDWFLLDERFENTQLQYNVLDYYEVKKTEKSFRFLRLVSDVKKWNGTQNLTFYNIDFYGDYIE